MRLALLGGFRLEGPQGDIDLGSRKLCGLLAYLACRVPEAQPRERLMTLFWGSHFDAQARQNLRQALTRIRRQIGFEVLRSSGDKINLDTDLVSCDVVEFAEAVRAGDDASLHRAVQLYCGPLLDDVHVQEEGWNEWVEHERRHLQVRAEDAFIRLGERELSVGHADIACLLAARAASINGMREDAHRLQMRALAGMGRRADALSYYARIKEDLRRQLDTDPDLATRELALALSRGDIAESNAAPAVPIQLTQCAPAGATVLHPDDKVMLVVVTSKLTAEQLPVIEENFSADRTLTWQRSEMSDGHRWDLVVPSASAATALAFSLQSLRCRAQDECLASLTIGADIALVEGAAKGRGTTLVQHAAPGQFVVSEDFRDHLADGLDAIISDLGFVPGPDKSERIRAFSIAAPGPPDSGHRSPSLALKPAIAVLPSEFEAVSPEMNTAGELLVDEIISMLSRSNTIDVISRMSSHRLARRKLDTRQIAAYLNADYLLVSRPAPGSPSDLVFELIETCSGFIRWRAERKFIAPDPLQVHDLAESIAAQVTFAIAANESSAATSRPMASLNSYALLFAANALMARWTSTSFKRAKDLLDELHSRAPLHALPNAWLSCWHTRVITQGWTADPRADGEASITYAQRSLDADPGGSLGLAMDAWAQVHVCKRIDIASARLTFAVEINPNDSQSWLFKGVTHAFKGEGELAVAACNRALQLSPLDPWRHYYESMASAAHLSNGSYEEGIRFAKQSLRINRTHQSTLRSLAVLLWRSGQRNEARQTVSELMAMSPNFTVSEYLRIHPNGTTPWGRSFAEDLRAAGVPD